MYHCTAMGMGVNSTMMEIPLYVGGPVVTKMQSKTMFSVTASTVTIHWSGKHTALYDIIQGVCIHCTYSLHTSETVEKKQIFNGNVLFGYKEVAIMGVPIFK